MFLIIYHLFENCLEVLTKARGKGMEGSLTDSFQDKMKKAVEARTKEKWEFQADKLETLQQTASFGTPKEKEVLEKLINVTENSKKKTEKVHVEPKMVQGVEVPSSPDVSSSSDSSSSSSSDSDSKKKKSKSKRSNKGKKSKKIKK